MNDGKGLAHTASGPSVSGGSIMRLVLLLPVHNIIATRSTCPSCCLSMVRMLRIALEPVIEDAESNTSSITTSPNGSLVSNASLKRFTASSDTVVVVICHVLHMCFEMSF